ncbi:MAG: crossover junction endodeoxyribonuclease RuvC [Planctomycetes bacterium]|nr:crossover junction endodeoxyribonuclease RuvC [Planctomycetota bacterium]
MTTPGNRIRVLGIDPGLNITGYGCVDFVGTRPELVEAGALRTSPRGQMPQRIAQLHEDLAALIADLHPDVIAVEQLYSHYKHPRTAILMGHARGVLLLAAAQAGLGVRNMAATMVKKSLTGNGHASKQQVQKAIQGVFKLAEPPSPPDVADALAIALCAGTRL